MKQFGEILFHGGVLEFSAYDRLGRRKYLTLEEGVRFLRASNALPLREASFCKTLFYTGCRISECLSLGPENFDLDQRLLRIQTLKKRGRLHVRRIPIPDELASELTRLKSPGRRFWNISRTTAWREIKSVMEIAEITGVQASPKGLRHGFGVRAALAGIPITAIQTWMGHANIATTAIYLDVRDGEERELMKKTWGDVL